MKKIKILGIALAAITGTLTSCGEDFLVVSPPTSLGQGDFYKTEADMVQALVAAYAPLQWEQYSWGWGHSVLVSDIMGDDMYSGGPGSSDNPYLHWVDDYSLNVSNTGELERWWTIGFSGVYRANLVTDYIDGVEMDADLAARIKAEAIFLRSYYYYNLWRFYGNIPYYEVNLVQPYVADQITSDEVYQNVVWGENGLDAIIKSGALPETLPANELGRVTLAAAQMLKARWVLYQNDESKFADVLADMKDIIAKGHHALKTTVDADYTKPVGNSPAMSYVPSAFEALYMQEGEFSKETIFDFNHVDVGSTENWGSPYEAGGTIYPTFIGMRAMTVNKDYYHDGWNFGSIPNATYDMYDDEDTRRDGGILDVHKWIDSYKAANPGTAITFNETGWKETGYYIKKYIGRMGYNDRGSGTGATNMAFKNNLRIFRYAETLLNAAELAVRAGDTGTAQGYLDQIRDRAYGDTDHRITATLENVKSERRKEFVADGIRYWDLVRWGDAEAVLGPKDPNFQAGGWVSNFTSNGVKRWLWPIPDSEMNRAASTTKPLTQNPGY